MKLYKEADLIDLVQSLKDYTHESHSILGHDERDAKEFVDIFLKDRTPIQLPNDDEIMPVKALEEDGDWYLIPNELYEEFKKDTYNEEMVESGGFDDKWWKYKTGGDLNLIQLYVEIQGGKNEH